MNQSLPTVTEEVIESVVAGVAADIDWLIDSFMPDGRPFGMEKLSEREQVRMYMESGLRNDREAAANWIRTKVQELQDSLAQFGVPPELILTVHPWDIVVRNAYAWSFKMEKLLQEESTKAAHALAPTAPIDPFGG